MSIRVTGGSLGGRFIHSPEGRDTRPTSAISRQAIFNILRDVDGAKVLDLFAGSGIVSVEFLSHGAERAILVDKGRAAIQLLHRNLREMGLQGQAEVIGNDVTKFLHAGHALQGSFDFIYADPPFTQEYPDLRPFLAWLAPQGTAIFEMPTRQLPAWSSEAQSVRKYGESSLAFFAAQSVAPNC